MKPSSSVPAVVATAKDGSADHRSTARRSVAAIATYGIASA
jgi:hypothetical protein